jgi:hypothetical protein
MHCLFYKTILSAFSQGMSIRACLFETNVPVGSLIEPCPHLWQLSVTHVPSQLTQTAVFQTYVWEISGRNFGLDIDCPQALQTNVRRVPWNRARPFTSKTF